MATPNFTALRLLPPRADQREVVDAVNGILRNFPQFGAADFRGIVTKTAAYTFDAGDYTILADASATATLVITLPPVATNAWRVVNVKKIDPSTNIVRIDGNDSETIDGAATRDTTSQWFSWKLHNDGAAWYIL